MTIVSIDQAMTALQASSIGVMPTDTVYGLVVSASDQSAVKRFYALKHREQKPGTLIAANTDQLLMLGVPANEIDQVMKYWPNPLSAVLKVIGHEYLHQDVGTLAMRVVADLQIRELLEQTGPLITSSANQPGKSPATTVDEAIAYFGDSIDFYVDGGQIIAKPSTIIRPSCGGIEILRQGSVTID